MAEEWGLAEDLDVMKRLLSVQGRSVVDVGCGAGALSRAMLADGATVVALEPEAEQAAANAKLLANAGIDFHQAGAQAIPCADNSMDGVAFSKSLHHVPQALMAKALEEAIRVLRSSGFLYVLEPGIHGSYTALMLPFHDETAQRNAAREALETLDGRFESMKEVHFHNRRHYRDFAAFVDQVSGYGFNAYRREDVETQMVRDLFERGHHRDGYWFEQPMRAYLFECPIKEIA